MPSTVSSLQILVMFCLTQALDYKLNPWNFELGQIILPFSFYLFYAYGCFATCMSVYHMGTQKRSSDSLGLELQMVVSRRVYTGNEPRCFGEPG